ncbi:MAG: lytic transglycosylase domain-containing protein, partial [Pseudomonadota bacterium]
MKKLILTALVALSSQVAAAQEARLEQFTLREPVSFRLLIPGREPGPIESPTFSDVQPPSSSNPLENTSIDLGTPSVRPYVPAWMRGGRSVFETRRPAQSARAADPDCLTHGYFLRLNISAEAQARRRLYFDHILTAACEARVPVRLFDALVSQESRYRPFARSHAGAMGMAQLMPGTARYLDVSDPWDP